VQEGKLAPGISFLTPPSDLSAEDVFCPRSSNLPPDESGCHKSFFTFVAASPLDLIQIASPDDNCDTDSDFSPFFTSSLLPPSPRVSSGPYLISCLSALALSLKTSFFFVDGRP